MRAAVAIALVAAAAATAHADDEFDKGTVIFARGQALFRVDAKGQHEAQIATFATKASVRALRTDAGGTVLLADIGGTWGWLPLDGKTTTITSLPCAPGPATLAEDGSAVACRGSQPNTTLIVELPSGKWFAAAVPPAGARLVGGNLIWADKTGVWGAPPHDVKDKTKRRQLAPDAPLREFSPSTDGKHAVAVYAAQVFKDNRTKTTAEVLMTFQLDGIGARRRSLRDAIPLDWSHDGKWTLVQAGPEACLLGATGGEYKCWRGFVAASTAGNGRWTLLLGGRDGGAVKPGAPEAPGGGAVPPADPEDADAENPEAHEDTAVGLPSGPLSLYRGRLEGLLPEKPVVIVRVVDGAAVWVPSVQP